MADKSDVLEALKHGNVFLTGGAGTGKSYITNEVIRHYRKAGKQVVALGSTGVSAVNIGGFTLHSFFVFGIADSLERLVEQDRRAKKRLSDLKKALRTTDLIVIDEISMVSATLLEMIAYRLRQYDYSGRLLFVGDFFQLPPVVRNDGSGSLFSQRLYAFESEMWERFDVTTIELTEMKRTKDDEFAEILSKIRYGICDEAVEAYLVALQHHRLTGEPTALFGRNDEVDRMNRERLNRLESEETILFADIRPHTKLSEKRLENWIRMLPANERLTLKIGAPVLFTVNKWGKYINGERGIVRDIDEAYILVEKDDAFVRVERHDFDLLEMEVEEDGTIEQVAAATFSQFPLKLAYAVTIHKSQGMSIDNLVCNVDTIFAPSQFYVALSRAVDPKRLRLEYTRGDLRDYLHRIVRVDERVRTFYKNKR